MYNRCLCKGYRSEDNERRQLISYGKNSVLYCFLNDFVKLLLGLIGFKGS